MNVTVTRASPDDAEDLLALQRLAYQSEAALYDDPGIPPLTQTLDELEAEFGDHVFLKALLDGRTVGSVRASQADGTCRIGRLVVDPDLQGHGIGTRLMREIEDRFGHLERFELFTGHKSERNLALYSRLGYAHDRSERVHDGLTLVYLTKRPQPPARPPPPCAQSSSTSTARSSSPTRSTTRPSPTPSARCSAPSS